MERYEQYQLKSVRLQLIKQTFNYEELNRNNQQLPSIVLEN